MGWAEIVKIAFLWAFKWWSKKDERKEASREKQINQLERDYEDAVRNKDLVRADSLLAELEQLRRESSP